MSEIVRSCMHTSRERRPLQILDIGDRAQKPSRERACTRGRIPGALRGRECQYLCTQPSQDVEDANMLTVTNKDAFGEQSQKPKLIPL